ncbi:MAG: DUF892 family protein [Bryobacteraceae bacterium]
MHSKIAVLLRAHSTGMLKNQGFEAARRSKNRERLGEKRTGKKCAAMTGLIKEGDELIGEMGQGSVRDAGLIAAAQKVEHYEISCYGSARTHARILGIRKRRLSFMKPRAKKKKRTPN